MGNGKLKTDNAKKSGADKTAIRRAVLEEIGRDRAFVFDAYAGTGKMHRAVWKDAAGYVGCDRRFFFDKRTAYVCDNMLAMRVIDLGRFTIFDFDAYGSPWDTALLMAERRKVAAGERIGVVLTDGSSLILRFGRESTALAKLSGLGKARSATTQDNMDVSTVALESMARMMGCRVARRWRAIGKNESKITYFGAVLVGLDAADEPKDARSATPPSS